MEAGLEEAGVLVRGLLVRVQLRGCRVCVLALGRRRERRAQVGEPRALVADCM